MKTDTPVTNTDAPASPLFIAPRAVCKPPLMVRVIRMMRALWIAHVFFVAFPLRLIIGMWGEPIGAALAKSWLATRVVAPLAPGLVRGMVSDPVPCLGLAFMATLAMTLGGLIVSERDLVPRVLREETYFAKVELSSAGALSAANEAERGGLSEM